MNYVSMIMSFMYYMITEIISNQLFQFFLYMIILTFIIKAYRLLVTW